MAGADFCFQPRCAPVRDTAGPWGGFGPTPHQCLTHTSSGQQQAGTEQVCLPSAALEVFWPHPDTICLLGSFMRECEEKDATPTRGLVPKWERDSHCLLLVWLFQAVRGARPSEGLLTLGLWPTLWPTLAYHQSFICSFPKYPDKSRSVHWR